MNQVEILEWKKYNNWEKKPKTSVYGLNNRMEKTQERVSDL